VSCRQAGSADRVSGLQIPVWINVRSLLAGEGDPLFAASAILIAVPTAAVTAVIVAPICRPALCPACESGIPIVASIRLRPPPIGKNQLTFDPVALAAAEPMARRKIFRPSPSGKSRGAGP